MRKQTEALIESLKGVANVTLIVAFIVYLYGVIGLQLFNGKIYYACRATPEPLPGATNWPFSASGFQLCNPHRGNCPEGTYCGNPYDFGLTRNSDRVEENAQV